MDSTGPPSSLNGTNTAGESPPSQKRQRAKQACEPCRLRKRRCDGSSPCNMCTQFEYQCYFEKHPRKRSKIVEANAIQEGLSSPTSPGSFKHEPTKEERTSFEDMSKLRSMEANSSIAFTRLLGLRLDPSSGPKLFTFGWNLGSSTYTIPHQTPITDLIGREQMYAMAQLYFANVHPLYGFVDKDYVLAQLSQRWTRPEACKVPDHFFATLAACGSVFSGGAIDALLPRLVDAAKCALESTSTMTPPTLVDVQSWILRIIYLRATDHPHATWMATCTAMHLVESIGIHQESSNAALHPSASDRLHDPEVRRRTFWVARMLNTWVSFEYGRTRVALHAINSQFPTPKEGDYTTDYVKLYSFTCRLDPDRSDQPGQWEDFMHQLEVYEVHHDCLELTKANLGMCAYRRLRLANPNLSGELTNRIIRMGLRGLEAARSMSKKGVPWWHVANVPFQVICIFLAMDVRESLAHTATALRTLEDVVARFHTVAMKEALKTARFLVRLSKKRKDEDANVLGQSLKKDIADSDPRPENLQRLVTQQHVNGGSMPVQPFNETPKTTTSNEDWNMDVLNDSGFDWNYFLTADMPAFNSFAPDGTM